MKRFLLIVLILGILGGGGWVAWKWYGAAGGTGEALNLVPADAIYLIATDDPIKSWKEVANTTTWTHLQRNAYFASLTSAANSLDSLIRDNDLLFDLIGSHSLIVSAHMIGTKDYDFIFLADLQGASGIKFLNDYIGDFATEGLSVRKEKYGTEDVFTIHDPADNTNLYISIPGSYLVASYTKKLLQSALDAEKNNFTLTREEFLRGKTDLDAGSTMDLYLNYSMLPKFMNSYSDGGNEYVSRLSQTLTTTSLSMSIDENLLKATGYTYFNDSIESYIKTLQMSGKGRNEFADIAPSRTSFALSLTFRSFAEFFANFESNLRKDVAEYDEYRKNLQQAEDYLKISVQKDIIDWVDDEVVLMEMQSAGMGVDNEMAVALKAKNIEEARDHLDFIGKQVRKRTPVKFKEVEHRGYGINYLGMKGLFKIILGRFFARYDKPYYTIVGNYVIFSNHPQTLESIIDDYLDKNTLDRSDEFRAFQNQFEDKSSVLIYLNTPVLFNTMKRMADASTRLSMEANKEFIVCFRHVGFQLVPETGRFKTTLAEQFITTEPINIAEESEDDVVEDDPVTDEAATADDEPIANEPEIKEGEADPMELPYMYVKDLNAKLFTEYFADSTTVHFKVELRNGFKDGSYTEYFENGVVKMTGKFNGDRRDGVWRLFGEDGKLIMRRSYDNGEIRKERTRD